MEVDFCQDCGQVISKNYLYCPHCGAKTKKPPEWDEVMNATFKSLENKQPAVVVEQLRRLSYRLEVLERDLDAFLLYAEMKNSLQS